MQKYTMYERYVMILIAVLTVPFSISCVSMTMTGGLYCATIRQKSTTVFCRGPCVMMNALRLW